MGRFDNMPSWSRVGMKICPCGGETALFYDELERYRVECAECDFVVCFKSDSMVNAKDKWQKYHADWTPMLQTQSTLPSPPCKRINRGVSREEMLYVCDPDINTECNKRGCHLDGGPCFMTKKHKYRKIEEKK